jgi:7-cyano-7-deazaguanine synthase
MTDSILTVLFSAGLDSAVLLAYAANRHHGGAVQPLYVSSGLAWEQDERAMGERFIASLSGVRPMAAISVDMRDVYSPSHWAIRGEAPAFDTPDTDVYLDGRNVILLSKASVYMARVGSSTVMLGSLSHNPFPDASRDFFDAMQHALSLGLAHPIVIETPFSTMSKEDVIRLGESLGVRFELTLSCMQPVNGGHCGRCSKCRERRDGFIGAGVRDPTSYAVAPPR